MEKTCLNDGVVFDAKRSTAKFCSDACRVDYNRKQKSASEQGVVAKVMEIKDDKPKVDTGVAKVITKVAEVPTNLPAKDIIHPAGGKGGGLTQWQLAIRKKKLGY